MLHDTLPMQCVLGGVVQTFLTGCMDQPILHLASLQSDLASISGCPPLVTATSDPKEPPQRIPRARTPHIVLPGLKIARESKPFNRQHRHGLEMRELAQEGFEENTVKFIRALSQGVTGSHSDSNC